MLLVQIKTSDSGTGVDPYRECRLSRIYTLTAVVWGRLSSSLSDPAGIVCVVLTDTKVSEIDVMLSYF